MQNFKELDMYPPIKAHFEELGFAVKGEVKGLDAALMRDGQMWAVEMKKGFNTTLLYQALNRQKAVNAVFVAIPRHVFMRRRGHILHILEKLSLGLVTVAMDSPAQLVDIHLMPNITSRRNSKASKALLAEFAGRNFDDNVGGSAKTKLLTVYREKALQVACALDALGWGQAPTLRGLGCPDNTYSILRMNTYGWFEKVGKATYALSDAGKAALDDPMFARVVAFYRKESGNAEI
ncbi:MAG: DUF2161 family putative PD-(D/E)XK-type phosphodiesterase [Defluviitaleaceae bacterium]|nr:DUF2161 family putative PD-(D/E)XK-type phosphodiesterase [Defluviitaleaceae bacterium]